MILSKSKQVFLFFFASFIRFPYTLRPSDESMFSFHLLRFSFNRYNEFYFAIRFSCREIYLYCNILFLLHVTEIKKKKRPQTIIKLTYLFHSDSNSLVNHNEAHAAHFDIIWPTHRSAPALSRNHVYPILKEFAQDIWNP